MCIFLEKCVSYIWNDYEKQLHQQCHKNGYKIKSWTQLIQLMNECSKHISSKFRKVHVMSATAAILSRFYLLNMLCKLFANKCTKHMQQFQTVTSLEINC